MYENRSNWAWSQVTLNHVARAWLLSTPVLTLLTLSLAVMRRRVLESRLANDESPIVTARVQIGSAFFPLFLFCLVFIGLFCFCYCCCFSHPRSVERIRPNIRPMQRLNSVFRNPGNFRLWNVLLHFVIPIALCNKIVALHNKKAVALCNDRSSGTL